MKPPRLCTVHSEHRPRATDIDVHHVWPLAKGGPRLPVNEVVICPTGHRNVHELLREYTKRKGVVPWSIRRLYSPGERVLAQLGWDRIQRKAL